jgi:hypothetical protein
MVMFFFFFFFFFFLMVMFPSEEKGEFISRLRVLDNNPRTFHEKDAESFGHVFELVKGDGLEALKVGDEMMAIKAKKTIGCFRDVAGRVVDPFAVLIEAKAAFPNRSLENRPRYVVALPVGFVLALK